MPDRSTLEGLLARVREATGPSRELDQDIFCAFDLAPVGADGTVAAYRAPMYSTSLDALAALQAEMLPGTQWRKNSHGDFFINGDGEFDQFEALGAQTALSTDCLTWLAAILSAYLAHLQAQEGAACE